MSAVHAIYENGVFKPVQPVDLPDKSHVIFEPHIVKDADPQPGMERVYQILSKTYDTDSTDLAQHHDEHQP